MGSPAAQVAQRKREKPWLYCPVPRCLWRTGDGTLCPRHGGRHPKDKEDSVTNTASHGTSKWQTTVSHPHLMRVTFSEAPEPDDPSVPEDEDNGDSGDEE